MLLYQYRHTQCDLRVLRKAMKILEAVLPSLVFTLHYVVLGRKKRKVSMTYKSETLHTSSQIRRGLMLLSTSICIFVWFASMRMRCVFGSLLGADPTDQS